MTKLFFSGFVQVALVAANTYFIANKNYVGVMIASFLISYVWSWNVKKIALGTQKERIVYASGAMTGGVIGLFIGQQF
jgi:hypothetical protein